MKHFVHNWEDDIFLLHVQVNNPNFTEAEVTVKRDYMNNAEIKLNASERIPIAQKDESYRFIVSRSHPLEKGVEINYPEVLFMKVFKLADRAYYPVKAFYEN